MHIKLKLQKLSLIYTDENSDAIILTGYSKFIVTVFYSPRTHNSNILTQ